MENEMYVYITYNVLDTEPECSQSENSKTYPAFNVDASLAGCAAG